MNMILRLLLSMSASGALLILAVFLGTRLLRDRLSRQWQYYIWLVVLFRLLLPFAPEPNLMGTVFGAVDQALTQTASGLTPAPQAAAPNAGDPSVSGLAPEKAGTDPAAAALPLQENAALLLRHLWLLWLIVALGMLIRKITIYQSFLRYVGAGMTPVSDLALLDRLSAAAETAGVKKPVELCINPLVSSPLLTGFFHPCIVLPRADIPEKAFPYVALHELTHYRRLDLCYSWLVQVTVCLHWFNPLVYLMSREITKACEFSCDEAVLAKTGYDSAQDYGQTLLDAMAAVGTYREKPGAVTLSENKKLLKERIGAIMKQKKRSRAVGILTAALTPGVILGAAFAGADAMGAPAKHALPDTPADQMAEELRESGGRLAAPVPDTPAGQADASPLTPDENRSAGYGSDAGSDAERFYEAGSLPLFEIALSRLDADAQAAWLKRLYDDGMLPFFSVAVRELDDADSLPDGFAETIYDDGAIAFFSVLADCMDETELNSWLDRALLDENAAFQSMLYDRLGRGDEYDDLKAAQEKEWEAARIAEYQAAGITVDGKAYYFQGQLVNIFLDMRANNAFYTLDMNPAGTVSIRVIRDTDDKITNVVYMADAEVEALLGDMDDPDGE